MTGNILYILVALLCASIASVAYAQEPDCIGNEFHPHPTNCTLYYACSAGVPILRECPDGLWWNPNINVCDFPVSSGCTAYLTTTTEPTTETETTPGTEPPTTTESTSDLPTETTSTVLPTETTTSVLPTESTAPPTTTTPIPTEPPVGPPFSCPAVDDPDTPVRLPHESLCDRYYLCNNGSKVLYACSGDYQFSYTQRLCYPPDEAGCDSCPVAVTDGVTIRLPHESDCSLYYVCVDTEPVLYRCRVEGDEFSFTVRECMDAASAGCSPLTTVRWGFF